MSTAKKVISFGGNWTEMMMTKNGHQFFLGVEQMEWTSQKMCVYY